MLHEEEIELPQHLSQAGYLATRCPDENAESPAHWDDSVKLYVWLARYDFGADKQGKKPLEIIHARKTDSFVFRVRAYIHGGIALAINPKSGSYPFTCQWDSGVAGLMVVPRSEVEQRFVDGKPAKWEGSEEEIEAQRFERARKIAQGSIEVWNQYLVGDVWGVTVSYNGEPIDSLFGLYGSEYAEQWATEQAQAHHEKRTSRLNAVRASVLALDANTRSELLKAFNDLHEHRSGIIVTTVRIAMMLEELHADESIDLKEDVLEPSAIGHILKHDTLEARAEAFVHACQVHEGV